MIYLTGDTHGEFMKRLTPQYIQGEEKWTARDKLIVLGDFGLVFYPRLEPFLNGIAREEEKKAFLEAKEYEILFIDGNHENFDRLTSEFPEEERYGGTVSRIGRNIFWLRRGQIYTIEGKTFFCMGGAYSIDKALRLSQEETIREQYGGASLGPICWWPQELPSNEEYQAAAKNLIDRGRRVDYVLTHTAPRSLIQLMRRAPDPHDYELTGFLDWIWYETSFRHWYFGHWHMDEDVHPKATAMFESTVGLPDDGPPAGC